MLDHRERRIICQSSFLVSPINEERTKEQWDSFLSLYRKERIPLVLLPVPAKEFCMAQRGLRPEFLCCLRLLVSGRSAIACLPDFLFMALSELSIVLFEARYRFRGSLAESSHLFLHDGKDSNTPLLHWITCFIIVARCFERRGFPRRNEVI